MKKKIVDFLMTKIIEIRVSLPEHEHDYVIFPHIAENGDSDDVLWSPGAFPMSCEAWNSFLQNKLLPAVEKSRMPENTGELLFEVTFSRKIWRRLFSIIYRSELYPDDSIYLFEVSESSDIAVEIVNEAMEHTAMTNMQERDHQGQCKTKCDARREIVIIRLDKDGKIV